MSMKRSDFGPREWGPSLTKQAFKDDADINKMLAKAQKAGTLSHLVKHGAYYADFADFDFDDAQFALARARSIFEELPSELRSEFSNNPGEFFLYVNDPSNVNDLERLLPGLAAPGRQLAIGKPGSIKTPASEGAPSVVSEPQASVQPQVNSPVGADPSAASVEPSEGS